MQKAISDKIQLGETLKEYSGVPSINDEGTLENLIGKADKVIGFVKTAKADGIYQGIILTFYQLPDNHKLLVKYLEKPMRALLIQIKNSLNLLLILLQILIVIIVQWKYVYQLSL